MNPARIRELESDGPPLTREEWDAGWRCCCEWDGMVVNIHDTEGEGQCCTCRGPYPR